MPVRVVDECSGAGRRHPGYKRGAWSNWGRDLRARTTPSGDSVVIAFQLNSMPKEPDMRVYALAQVYHDLKRPKEADAALQELIQKYSANGAFLIGGTYAYRGEADQAFAWLERAYRQRDAGCSTIKASYDFARLRSDPRYAAFLKKMNLPLD